MLDTLPAKTPIEPVPKTTCKGILACSRSPVLRLWHDDQKTLLFEPNLREMERRTLLTGFSTAIAVVVGGCPGKQPADDGGRGDVPEEPVSA